MTLIGGQVLAGTPAPHGALWFSSTQFRAASAPMMNRPAPVERSTSLAPGAAPCWTAPPTGRRTTGDDAVDVGAVAAERQGVGVDAVRHLLHRALGLGRLAQRLVVGHDGAAAVGLLEVRVGRVDAGVDDADGDALAGQRAAVGAGERLGGLEAAGGLVGGLGEEADRLGARLDVRDAGLAAHRLDLGLGAAGADDADLLEGRPPWSARRRRPPWSRRPAWRRGRGRWSSRSARSAACSGTARPRPARARRSPGVGAASPSATTAAAPAASEVRMRARTSMHGVSLPRRPESAALHPQRPFRPRATSERPARAAP